MKFSRQSVLSLSLIASLCLPPAAQATNVGQILNWAGGMRLPVAVPSVGGLRLPGTTSQPTQQPSGAKYQSMQLGHQAYELDTAGEHDAALQLLEQAVQLDPQNEIAWGNLMHECALTGRLQQTVEVGQRYLQLHPHGTQFNRVNGMLTNARAELKREQEIEQTIGPSSSDDYLSMTSENGMLKHWPLQGAPIKVYIEDGSGVKGYDANFATTMIESFKEWSVMTNNRLTFEPAKNAEEAQIVCTWIDDQKKFPNGYKYGECGFSQPRFFGDGSIVSSHVWILTMNKTQKRPYTNRAIHGVCLHEIGHTLGLIGHSDKAGDIMYFMGDTEPASEPHLSWRDINTINRLYSTAQPTFPTTSAQTAQEAMQTSQPFTAPASIASSSMPPAMMPMQAPAMFATSAMSAGPAMSGEQPTYSGAPAAGMYPPPPMSAAPAMYSPDATPPAATPSPAGIFASSEMAQTSPRVAAPAVVHHITGHSATTHCALAHSAAAHPTTPATYMQVENYTTTAQGFRNGKEAIDFFEAAANRTANVQTVLDDLGSAYNNHAIELAAAGDLDGAHAALEHAVAIHRNSFDRPRLDASISNYMMLLVKQGRLTDAQKVYNNYRQGNLAFFSNNTVH